MTILTETDSRNLNVVLSGGQEAWQTGYEVILPICHILISVVDRGQRGTSTWRENCLRYGPTLLATRTSMRTTGAYDKEAYITE